MSVLLRQALFLLFGLLLTADFGTAAPPPQKMRPYTGVGVLLLSADQTSASDPVTLYGEPAMHRSGELVISAVPLYEWLFGSSPGTLLLIVTARKGEWVRAAYDDAGREAWLKPRRSDRCLTWEQFLKSRVVRPLPGLRKQFYQMFQKPGKGTTVTLTPKNFLKVIRLEGDWAMVMPDPNTLGWLRWRDDDGRLLLAAQESGGR